MFKIVSSIVLCSFVLVGCLVPTSEIDVSTTAFNSPLVVKSNLQYLPLVRKDYVSIDPNCFSSEGEEYIAEQLTTHPLQKRPSLTCDARLANAAQFRADYISINLWFEHCDPTGYCPNDVVRDFGYELPKIHI